MELIFGAALCSVAVSIFLKWGKSHGFDALQMITVNYAVASEELETFTQNLVSRICENSPRAISVMKEAVRGLISRQDLPVSEFERLQELRHAVYSSGDYAEGLDAIRNKRKPNFSEKTT